MAVSNTHQSIHIPSTTIPDLSVRFIGSQDGAAFANILNAPGLHGPQNKAFDEEWGHGAVGRFRDHAEQNPTVTDSNGQVVSGPAKANLFVVEGDEPIGIAGTGCIKTFERDGRKLRAGDVGIVLKEDKRGKGYGTEGMKLSLDFGAGFVSQGGLQLDLLTITTLEDNFPMFKVIERLGIRKQTGVLRPAEHDEGKQEWYFEIPAEEWRQKRSQK